MQTPPTEAGGLPGDELVRDLPTDAGVPGGGIDFRIIAEKSLSLILVTDQDGMIQYVNPTFCSVTGWTPDEIVGQRVQDLGRVGARAEAALRDSLGSGMPWRGEFVARTANGRELWVFSSVSPITDAEGKVTHFIAINLDVTERKRAEQALAESEEMFRTLVDSMPAAVVIFQGNHVRYANRTCFDVLGYSPEDLPKLRYWDAIHPDYRDLVRERGSARLRGEDVPNNYEMRFLKKDGEARWGVYSGAAITYQGKPAVLGVIHDVTDRKRSEEALRESEQKFRTLVDTLPAAAFIFQGTRLRYANHMWYDALGYTEEDLANLAFWEILHPDYRGLVRERGLARLRGEDVPSSYEVCFLNKSGESRWGLYSGALIAYEAEPAVIGVVYDITDRKRIEEALIESEERFRKLAETTTAATFIFDGAHIRYANSAAASITGYSVAELTGKNFWEISHPQIGTLTQERIQATPPGRPIPARAEVGIVTKDGETRWLDLNMGFVEIGGKELVLGTGFDITERRESQQALRDSEEKFRRLAESVPAGTFIVQGTNIRFANTAMEKVFGYTAEEFSRMDFWEAVHPEFQQEVKDRGFARQTGAVAPGQYEVKVLRKDGKEVWALVTASAIEYEGAPAAIGSIVDLTDHKTAQEELRRSEERYRLLYQDNPSMYFTLSEDLSVLSVNRHGAEQLGYEAGELVGGSVLAVVHPDDQTHVRRQLESLVKNRGAKHGLEFRKIRKDGSMMWVKESVSVTQDANGERIILVVCEDISERKQMEEALQGLREELERKAQRAVEGQNPYGLTFRELTVLHLVTGGRSDKEIGVVLGIRSQTVSKHVANVLKKMKASSRTQAGVRALREGLIS